MIVISIVILIIILILANIALGIYNYMYPVCVVDYFKDLENDSSNPREIERLKNERMKKKQSTEPNERNEQKKLKEKTYNDFKTFMNKQFETKNKQELGTKKGVSGFKGEKIAMFEIEMEGVQAPNKEKQKRKGDNQAHESENDGYTERRPNDW